MTSPLHYTLRSLRLFIALTGVIAFLSCSDDQHSLSEAFVPATFMPSIESSTKVTPTTRVTNDTWASGDQIGIYMLPSGKSVSSAIAENIPYKTAISGVNTSLVAVRKTIYYPTNGSKVNFMAYYPYKADFETDYTYPIDVTEQNPATDIDLLYHKGTTDYSQYNAAATLNFEHKLSKIIVDISRGTGVTSDLKNLTTQITGIPTKASFSLATGSVSLYEGDKGNDAIANISPVKNTISTTESRYIAEAILIPHTGEGYTRDMEFSIGGNTYTYPIPATQHFESGKVYTYDLIFSAAGIALAETTITDWTGGSTSWDGKYILTTNTGSLSFPANPLSSQEIAIRTRGTNTDPKTKISTLDDPEKAPGQVDWIENVSLSTAKQNNGWNGYTLTITTKANPETLGRTAYILLSLEGLTIPITINQEGATP